MIDDDVLDERIRAALRQDLGSLDGALVEDPAGVVRTHVRARRRRRRAALVTAVAVCLVAIAATMAIVVDDDAQEVESISPTIETSPSTAAPTSAAPTVSPTSRALDTILPLPGGLARLPAPPLSPRYGPAMIWTGSEIVAWGATAPEGGQSLTDGAAYDVTARRWRLMAESPLPGGGEYEPVGVMTGSGVVIAQGSAAARWDPSTDTWHELPDPPRPVKDLATDGTLVVSASANAVLDTRSGRWRELPEPPVTLERSATAWTGDELVVIGGPSTPFTSAVALGLDLVEGRWRRLADPPDRLHAEALSADWDGEHVIVVNYDMQAVAYDPQTDRWEQLPATPARFYENSPTFVSSGDGTGVAFHALAAVVRTTTGAWIPLPNDLLPGGRVLSVHDTRAPSTRGMILVWAVDAGGDNRPYALDPARFAESAPAVQVGIARLDIPARTVVETRYGISDDEVQLVTEAAPGVQCTITSGYSRTIDDPPLPIAEPLDNGQATPTGWRRDEAGTRWQAQVNETTDTLTISCDAADAARNLAVGARFP